MSKNYLYGAAIQGIQGFIFQTNKLREIIGASELVEEICTSLFKEYHSEKPGTELIIGAAGNIKCIFEKKEDCENAVLNFPQKVLKTAPGITVSQAVVEFDENDSFKDVVDELESRLRIQRNIPAAPTQYGALGINRSRQTGLPAVVADLEEGGKSLHIDESTLNKLYRKDLSRNLWRKQTTKELSVKFFNDENILHREIPYDIRTMTGQNDWVAIIHADGNGLGQVVQKVGKSKEYFREFSDKLNKATTEAAQKAVADVLKESVDYAKLPMRPVVLGGDDLTIICKADLALDFTEKFLKYFEEKTKEYLGEILKNHKVFPGEKDYLTACAGIAYIKSSYPFYYGYDLAEGLCSESKKAAKKEHGEGGLAPSCLMFHKVQDSFVKNYNDISDRELSINEKESWKFGPYYLEHRSNFWSISDIREKANNLTNEDSAIKSYTRKWISAKIERPGFAEQILHRAFENIGKKKQSESMLKALTNGVNRDDIIAYPAFDVLALHSIMYQKTK